MGHKGDAHGDESSGPHRRRERTGEIRRRDVVDEGIDDGSGEERVDVRVPRAPTSPSRPIRGRCTAYRPTTNNGIVTSAAYVRAIWNLENPPWTSSRTSEQM
jgi:hypothetical protein